MARNSDSVTSAMRLVAVDRVQHALVGVVVDDLEHRRQLLLEAGLDRLWLVVLALVQLRAVVVASAGHLRRVGLGLVNVIVGAAAQPAAG